MSKEKEKISLTRALAKIKLLDKQLQNNSIAGFDVEINGKLKYNQAMTAEEFIKQANSQVESFKDLFDYRLKLKGLVAKANIETKVMVNGKEYSIIELIDLKSSINYKLNLINNLIQQYNKSTQIVEQIQNKIEEEVSQQVSTANSNKNQVSKDLVQSLTKTYTELWSGTIKGLDIKKLEQEKLEIEALVGEVDMTLSEVNSQTMIEI